MKCCTRSVRALEVMSVKFRPNKYISWNIIQDLLRIVACCLIVFIWGMAKRMQYFVQHFFKNIQSTTKLGGVARRVQRHTTSRKTKEMLYRTAFVSEKVWLRSHFIQHDTTRYNKAAKRVQHFIQHQSCIMLYKMLYSFGRGLKGCLLSLLVTSVLL